MTNWRHMWKLGVINGPKKWSVLIQSTNKVTGSMSWRFSHKLLYKTLIVVAWLVCRRRAGENDRIQTKGRKKETKTEGSMTKKKKKGAEKREMRQRHCCPPGVQVGRFLAWAAGSAAWRHTTGTNGGFMILYQLSAVCQHLTASYKKWHHNKQASCVTDEQWREKQGETAQLMAPHPEDISRLILATLVTSLEMFSTRKEEG